MAGRHEDARHAAPVKTIEGSKIVFLCTITKNVLTIYMTTGYVYEQRVQRSYNGEI